MCVAARSRDDGHFRVDEGRFDPDRHQVEMDYTMAQEKGKTTTILTMVSKTTGFGAATVVPSKGAGHPFVVRWVVKQLARMGVQRFVLRTDSEPSIMEVARRTAAELNNGTVVENTARANHQGLGAVERYHQTLHA